MATYLKLFETHTQYETFIGGGGNTPFVKPNVSYCTEENEVYYNPKTMADKYLTVRILENGELGFGFVKGLSLDYSFNGGITWDGTLTNDNNTILVTNGQEISFKKGNITSNDNSASDRLKVSLPTNYGKFFSNCQFEVFGNVMSIIDSENFANANVIHEDLSYLFDNCTKLVNAENLILPATTLASNCYESMFYGCTGLTTAPELPATTLASGCYSGMFYGCTSLVNAPTLPATTLASECYESMFSGCTKLNYIKAMFTTKPSTTYTSSWVSGVASSGRFVKNATATWNVTGDNGIPSGWTVETATV